MSVGFSLKTWKKSAEESKNYSKFKLYKIKCFNEDEEFYKVGITFIDIKQRFKTKIRMPYSFNIIEIIESDDAEYIWNLEKRIHEKLNDLELSYKPKLYFAGYSECFKSIEIDK